MVQEGSIIMNTQNKVGVALTNCYFCGKGDRILLNTLLTPVMAQRVESAHGKVIDMEPCSECKKWMDRGIILLTIDGGKSEPGWNSPPTEYSDYERRKGGANPPWMPNPYRAGGFFVMKEEAFKRIFNGEAAAFALKHRWMFIEQEAADKIGLKASE